MQVSPELLDGAATPVLKHVQVGLALELHSRSGHHELLQPCLCPSPALTAPAMAPLLEPWDSEGRSLCHDGLVCRRRGSRALLLIC